MPVIGLITYLYYQKAKSGIKICLNLFAKICLSQAHSQKMDSTFNRYIIHITHKLFWNNKK